MNTNDHPNLTAYALGELDAEHAEAMARWVVENPEAQAEIEALGDLSLHLQNTAPLAMASLHPHQREAVLNGPQRVRQLVAAAQLKQQCRPVLLPFLHSMARLAAAAVLVFAGYIAGTHFAKPQSSVETAKTTSKPSPAPTTMTPFKAIEVPQLIATQPAPTPAPEKVETQIVLTAPPAVAPSPVIVAKVTEPATKEPSAKPATPTNRLLTSAFINTTRDAHAEVILRPVDTRPAPAPKGSLAASPIKQDTKSTPPLAQAKRPDLLIHSWKAEVASCPWDEARRLIRLVVQIPGDQPAATPGYEYPLHIGFDPKYVRNYRTLGERSVPAVAADAPAFHIAWYEFTPNGQTADAARVIGNVTLPNAHFTTATTAPFDGTSLQIVDRGTGWASTRDDFVFESAVMGFGLLLKGDKDCGTLDHALVLDLAQRAGAEDRESERGKFAKLVKEAQRATGL